MARKTKKSAKKIVGVAGKSLAKPWHMSKKVAHEIEAVAAIAFAAVIIYFLLMIFIYPQKVEVLKAAIVPAAENKTPLPVAVDYEKEYLQSAKVIGKVHDFGQFKTKLLKVGFYNGLFRADIWTKNVGKETADFQVERAFMRKQGGAKYDYAGGNFTGKQFLINEERSGYVLYKDVPTDISGTVTVVIGNSVSYSAIFSTIMSSPHMYIIEI